MYPSLFLPSFHETSFPNAGQESGVIVLVGPYCWGRGSCCWRQRARPSVGPWRDCRAWSCAAASSRVVRVCLCRVLRCCCWCLSALGAEANRSPKWSAGCNDQFAFLCHSEGWKGSDSGFCSGYWFTLTTSWPCCCKSGIFWSWFFFCVYVSLHTFI